jgi:hypothetical protein
VRASAYAIKCSREQNAAGPAYSIRVACYTVRGYVITKFTIQSVENGACASDQYRCEQSGNPGWPRVKEHPRVALFRLHPPPLTLRQVIYSLSDTPDIVDIVDLPDLVDPVDLLNPLPIPKRRYPSPSENGSRGTER